MQAILCILQEHANAKTDITARVILVILITVLLVVQAVKPAIQLNVLFALIQMLQPRDLYVFVKLTIMAIQQIAYNVQVHAKLAYQILNAPHAGILFLKLIMEYVNARMVIMETD